MKAVKPSPMTSVIVHSMMKADNIAVIIAAMSQRSSSLSGFAKQMLDHLAAHSQENGVHVLRLETGVYQDAAIKLYERYGFKRIPPFGDYVAGKDNLFYEKTLA